MRRGAAAQRRGGNLYLSLSLSLSEFQRGIRERSDVYKMTLPTDDQTNYGRGRRLDWQTRNAQVVIVNGHFHKLSQVKKEEQPVRCTRLQYVVRACASACMLIKEHH